MRKIEMISKIVKMTGMSRVDVLVVLENFFTETKASLREGEPVFLRGFGSFVVKQTGRKVGRDLINNIPIEIPERLKPVFIPAIQFKNGIKTHGKSKTDYGNL